MSKNFIFCFSGTGNSLHVAKEIAKQNGAVIVPMTGEVFLVGEDTETIGFVYPTYFGGLPQQVRSYINKLQLPSSTYAYAITTYGGMYANGIRALHMLLKEKHATSLSYGEPLHMQGNYIVMYPMETDRSKMSRISEQAEKDLQPLIKNILEEKITEIKNSNWLISKYTSFASGIYRKKDRCFIVSDRCIACKRCEEICPVGNIVMENNKPIFLRQCEQCMACIQTCPEKAINYKTKTNEGERYFHPDVTVQELIRFNHTVIEESSVAK